MKTTLYKTNKWSPGVATSAKRPPKSSASFFSHQHNRWLLVATTMYQRAECRNQSFCIVTIYTKMMAVSLGSLTTTCWRWWLPQSCGNGPGLGWDIYVQYFGTRGPPPRRCNFPTKAEKTLTVQRTPRMRCCLARLLVPELRKHRVRHIARWNTLILSHAPGKVPGPAYSHFITCGGRGCWSQP